MEAPTQTSGVAPYPTNPRDEFHSFEYLRHNQRRQEHLASLNLPLAGTDVLEVGAGIGDHTTFFLDRGCRVVSTEGRPDNLVILRQRFPTVETHLLDMENPDLRFPQSFDIVYCYGLLYHLQNPGPALAYMAACCRKMLLLETCVTPGDGESINPVTEQRDLASQAVSGRGCRPNRRWVFAELRKHFPHVYMPLTQPWHEEFPIDWTVQPANSGILTRAIFVACREQLDNALLGEGIPMHQKRH